MVATTRVARARDVELGEPRPHDGLVLGVHQGVRAGTDGDAVSLEGVQVGRRHVLVVEGHDRAAGGHRAQGGEVGVVADDVVGDHLGGRDALGLGEQPQRQAQRDRWLRHHPGELTATDHGKGGGAL